MECFSRAEELRGVWPLKGAQGRLSAAKVQRNWYAGGESHIGWHSGGHCRQSKAELLVLLEKTGALE